MFRSRVGRVVCGFALFMPAYSFGALVTGSLLNTDGSFNVGATFLNWNCDQPGDTRCTPTPPAGQGDFLVAPSTGTFAQYTGTFGLITDINNASQPLNTPISLPNFMTFDLNSNETITLTFLPVGTDTPSSTCTGLQNCTPQSALLVTPANPLGLSAFNLNENQTGTAAVFGFMGTITDTPTNQVGTISGTFTSQLNGVTPEQALIELANAGAVGLPVTYSAQASINSVVPEPVTLALTGAGLLGLGLFRRKWHRV